MESSFSLKAPDAESSLVLNGPFTLLVYLELISRMFWTRPVDLEPFIDTPFVIDAETGQACDCVTLSHVIQAYRTLTTVLGQNVLVIIESGFGETHLQMNVYFIRAHKLHARRTMKSSGQQVR